MRRIDARRGTENFKALFLTEFELLAKNQQGCPLAPPPPSGRGLRCEKKCIFARPESRESRIFGISALKTIVLKNKTEHFRPATGQLATKLETREFLFAQLLIFCPNSAHYCPRLLLSQRIRDRERKDVSIRYFARTCKCFLANCLQNFMTIQLL